MSIQAALGTLGAGISRAQADLARQTRELSTGHVADIPAHLGAQMTSYSSALARSVGLEARLDAATEADLLLETRQQALSGLSSRAETLGLSVFERLSVDMAPADSLALQGQAAFEDLVRQTNSQVAGRAVFSGAAEGVPLPDAASLLAELQADLSGLFSADDIRNAIDAWFLSPGTEYEARLNTAAGQVFQVPDGQTAFSSTIDAGNEPFRMALTGAAMLACCTAPGLAEEDVKSLAGTAAARLLSGADGFLNLQEKTGLDQTSISRARDSMGRELQGLQHYTAGFVAADPAETITEILHTEAHLKALYTAFSRISDLSLVNYLK